MAKNVVVRPLTDNAAPVDGTVKKSFALARIAQYGSKSEKRTVGAAIKKRFPSIGKKKRPKES